MKIAKELRDIYSENVAKFKRLSEEVEAVLKPLAEAEKWFFVSRVKGLESFALKMEAGRSAKAEQMEDFFGCTLIVPTVPDISMAEEIVRSRFSVHERRPASDDVTHKASSNFVFDDLRMYVSRRPSSSGKNEDLVGVVFEVQIKTVLQYAWAIATHDLIYKTNEASWPRERIAYQVKAMLEHAELAIAETGPLSIADSLAKQDRRTADAEKVMGVMSEVWSEEALPVDLKRLAETVRNILRSVDLEASQFSEIIDSEVRRTGALSVDLSPYAFSVQALAHFDGVNFERKFKRLHVRTRLVIHGGMDLPAWMWRSHPRIVSLSEPLDRVA